MKIYRAYKTELDPNNAQRTLFIKACGVARFAWNWGLARRIEEYKLTGKSSSCYDQQKQLNAIKDEQFPWMREVSKSVPEGALGNVDSAFKNFWRRCKEGKGTKGFPRFKSKRNGLGSFKVRVSDSITNNAIWIARVGWVRLKERGYIPTSGVKINSATVSEKAGRWFVSVQVEKEIAVTENQGPATGLDLGLNKFVVGSDGFSLEAPKPLKRSLKRLQKLSRRVSRKQKGSKNRRKAIKRLAKFHYRISNQRKDFLHKASTMLTKTKSMIVVEDLNVDEMVKNRSLARSIQDSCWSEFVRQLEYKCPWHDSKLVKVDRFFPSTKTCSSCGEVKDEMPLSVRVYECEGCGLKIDRDLNAAINILNEGLKQLPPDRRKVTPAERPTLCTRHGDKVARGSRNRTKRVIAV